MCYVLPRICFDFTDIFLAMSVSMYIGIKGVHLSLDITITMAFKRGESKDTIESTTWVAAKQVSMILPTYEDIKLFMDKDIKIRYRQHHNEKHH